MENYSLQQLLRIQKLPTYYRNSKFSYVKFLNFPLLFLCIFTVYSSTSDLVLVLISIGFTEVWMYFMSNEIRSVKCSSLNVIM